MKHILALLWSILFLFHSPFTGHVDSVTLNKTDITLSPGQSETLVATLKPDGVRALVTWSSSDTKVCTVDENGKVTAVSPGTTTINVKARTAKTQCQVTVRPAMEPVDLGVVIEDGGKFYKVLWGDRNLGAPTPFDAGGYYAWGETTPKEEFSWETYKWSDQTSAIFKYCDKDGRTVLEPEDDAASVELGDGWITPTAEMAKALLDQCYLVRDGAKVLSVNSRFNDSYIYLPACGYFSTKSIVVNSDCYFLTSSLFGDQAGFWTLHADINGSDYEICALVRGFDGAQIRPVKLEEVALEKLNITVTNLLGAVGAYSQLSMKVQPSILASLVEWSSTDERVCTVDKTGKVTFLGAGEADVVVKCGSMSSKCHVTVNAPQPVDLGMILQKEDGTPYKLYWGDRNLGATSPYDPGFCYKTEIIQEVDSEGKTVYSVNDPTPELLGGKWRMPTSREMEALINCNWTRETVEGMDGRGVTGSSGNSIFLPSERNAGGKGWYWTSTVVPDDSPAQTLCLVLEPDKDYIFGFYNSRTKFGIRPVWEGESGEELSPDKLTLDITTVNMQVRTSCEIHATAVPALFEKVLTWSSSDERVVTVSDGKLIAWSPGKATVTVGYGGRTVRCSVTVTSRAVPEGAVDLGTVITDVRDSYCRVYRVFWAKYNLGASKPEECGNYYAWGETKPKTTYSLDNYKWCSSSRDTTYTKFCPADLPSRWGGEGKPDGLTSLRNSLEDDAARAALGGGWRIPSPEEWQLLKQQCTWVWTNVNGIKGYIVSSPNGNSIFLPAAGWMWNRKEDVDTYGYYLSSALAITANSAKCIRIQKSGIYDHNCYRFYGIPIRPVTE